MTLHIRKRLAWKPALLVLLVILIVGRVGISIGTVPLLNTMLPGILGTGAAVDTVHIGPLNGHVSVRGLIIDQPDGFDGDPLCSLGNATIDVSTLSVLHAPFTIESINVDGLCLRLIRNTNGTLNVATLGSTADANAATAEERNTENDPDAEDSPSSACITITRVHIKNLSISYEDLSCDPPLRVHVADCDGTAVNILLDPAGGKEGILPGFIRLTARLEQPPRNDAYVGLQARVGIIGTNAPAVVAAMRAVGIELKPLGAVVPTGTSQTLGGSCVDVYGDLRMSHLLLDANVDVKTEDCTLSMAVGGTPYEPNVDKSCALFNLITRPSALVGGIVADAGSATVEAAGATLKTTAALGLGALKTVGSIGMGVAQAGRGVVTADLDDVGEGLKTATVGTVSEAVDTVVDTTLTAADGVGSTASAAIGKADTDAWRATCRERWESLWLEARGAIHGAPYPRLEEEPPTNTTASAEAMADKK